MIVDLSHVFHDGMPGVRFRSETGETVELTAHIRPYMTHAQSHRHYDGKASFEISDVAFQSSVGTKMDAPRHRFEGADDVASIELDRLVLDGALIDARHAGSGQQLGWADLNCSAWTARTWIQHRTRNVRHIPGSLDTTS